MTTAMDTTVAQHILEMFTQLAELEALVEIAGLEQTWVQMVAEQMDTLDKHTQTEYLLEAHIIQKLQRDLEHNLEPLLMLAAIVAEALVEITLREAEEELEQSEVMDQELLEEKAVLDMFQI
jgi:ABC-type dipeptide/oligopeptide/nickel transport system ATPase subunit